VTQEIDIMLNNIKDMTQVTHFYVLSRIEKYSCYTHVTSKYLYILRIGEIASLVSLALYTIDIYMDIANLLCHFLKKLCHCCVTNLFGVPDRAPAGPFGWWGPNLKRATEL
jgi:hypothetical protein